MLSSEVTMSSGRRVALTLIAGIGACVGCRGREHPRVSTTNIACEPNPGTFALEASFVFRVIQVPSGTFDGPHVDADGYVVQRIRPAVRERPPLRLRLGTAFGRVPPDGVWFTQHLELTRAPPPGGWRAPQAPRPKDWRDR